MVNTKVKSETIVDHIGNSAASALPASAPRSDRSGPSPAQTPSAAPAPESRSDATAHSIGTSRQPAPEFSACSAAFRVPIAFKRRAQPFREFAHSHVPGVSAKWGRIASCKPDCIRRKLIGFQNLAPMKLLAPSSLFRCGKIVNPSAATGS
jgi:hypothetical protein